VHGVPKSQEHTKLQGGHVQVENVTILQPSVLASLSAMNLQFPTENILSSAGLLPPLSPDFLYSN